MTIRSLDRDPRVDQVIAGAAALGLPAVSGMTIADVVHIDGDLSDEAKQRLHGLLVDPLLQMGTWAVPTEPGVEIALLPGVTDTAADAVRHATTTLGIDIEYAATGLRVEFDAEVDEATRRTVVARFLVNPIVDQWTDGTIEPVRPGTEEAVGAVESIPMRGLDDDALAELNVERALYLDPEELRVIRDHFTELDRDPTDVEIETLAQTWSEHCAHKTFRAVVHALEPGASESDQRPSLMHQLRSCTEAIGADYVRSAFVGNAGVIEFQKGTTLALKAETHNHPSAVEPFGGANTGVGGVIRDVLGIAHRPIAITDILCFGPTDLPLAELPEGTLHPRRIEAGVIDGVADYGNKIGLPTVAGAILYDPAYTTNPLVFAGCIGSAPSRSLHDGPHAGDRVLVLGGATGRDGIRGATFSSATMDATTGEVAGASVQIGDPIVEKLLIDVLVGAEDMYSAITDCGAGGLSSAIGEMAEGIGADVDLALVPRKYPGLEPWEVWLSEAQERMVVSVPPRGVSALANRCERVGVGWSDIGSFTGDGTLIVRNGDDVVAELDTTFLHDGRPQRHMNARLPDPRRSGATTRELDDPAASILALLGHPNIASKAATIHRYDHEILGSTVVRPLVGAASDGPADGVVLAQPTETHGFAIGIGVNPWFGLHDPEAMAFAAVDEAVRNAVAVGADPERIALLDNFSWGDPRRESTMGDLVAAVDGACAAAFLFNAPFVSGKDSLNNEYLGGDGERHAVPPTLVITAVGHVPDADHCITPDLVSPGNLLMLIGSTETEFAGSHYDLVHGEPEDPGVVPAPDTDAAMNYQRLHAAMRAGLVVSCHDVSEGGLAVALAEMCIAGRLGAKITELPHDNLATALFSESIGRLVVEVEERSVDAFRRIMDDELVDLGTVSEKRVLSLPGVDPIHLSELIDAFNSRAQAIASVGFDATTGNDSEARS
ncbi:phosphoribosylformylglycinamidine synthase subunit PurL [Ilumatobacter nonamiensis]|uniref:phosphoribosylformylglycinamidine synthase subunit PurL n=1 Tax=Ilumatobacter nonamiensis TaxID=467093 RepID=UPI0003460420|nr:phosphoribosylformylglycinamidine synthase subunit PurL [Ilumatobacter nonamiensis]